MAKSKKSFQDLLNSYKKYDPEKEERGDTSQWQEAFRVRMNLDEAREILGDSSPRGLLGVSIHASWIDIIRAFRKRIFEVHPDRILFTGFSVEQATRKTREINAAYAILSAEFGKA